MTPKDTLEAANPAAETASAQGASQSKAESGHLRAGAVSLDVPVKIHGSRVTEVVLGTTSHTEPFEEQTSTMIVFPQGGVVKMSTPVTVGQMVVLTNLKSGHDAICRILKMRVYAQTQSYVELEFTHRQPGYWGVRFAADEAEAEQPVVSVLSAPIPHVPLITVDVKIEKPSEKPAPEISRPPASGAQTPAVNSPNASSSSGAAKRPEALSELSAHTSKAESSFVSIGSQEEVQPAASSTSRATRNPFSGSENNSWAAEVPKKTDSPAGPPAVPVPSLSMEELQGDSLKAAAIVPNAEAAAHPTVAAPAAAETTAQSQPAPFGRFAAAASFEGTRAAGREPFGAGLGSGTLGLSGHAAEAEPSKTRNWLLIVACAAALLFAGTGAAFYFHQVPGGILGNKSNAPAPTGQSIQPDAATGATTPESNTLGQTTPQNSPAAASAPAAHLTETVPAATSRVSSPAQTPTNAPTAQKPPARVPDMFGALNAHPVSPLHASGSQGSDAEPSVDAGASAADGNGELPVIAGSSTVAPPPPPQAPVRVGGDIKPPRLISSVQPVYPNMARQAGVDGDVIVDALIDKNGNVASMKVISGPQMLRQAALDALHGWKYEPSRLNGEPVSAQMTVTVRFHRE